MANALVSIGKTEKAAVLYSYPNNPDLGWTLCQTIEHWFEQTLLRDGFNQPGAETIKAVASDSSGDVTLTLSADASLQSTIQIYASRLGNFIAAGWEAYTTVVPMLKETGKWDPRGTCWRFFLPMGLPMVNQHTLQFFHYPPQKMLDSLQDYLNDPVPHRVEDLLCQNGVANRAAAQKYETIIDGAPIAAPDDAGSAKGGDPEWGLIPIQYFSDYQKSMMRNLLNPSPFYPGYTIPIMVYGNHPRKIFSMLFLNGVPFEINQPTTIEILPGLTTPVVGADHPYDFYWTSQFSDQTPTGEVGDGKMVAKHCAEGPWPGSLGAFEMMRRDLISAGWQAEMASNPSQDGNQVMAAVTTYWNAPENANIVCALTQSQATLLYTDAAKTTFEFRVGVGEASSACEAHGNQTCTFQV